ncbi:hypothetical protein [Microbacterium lacticum]
MSPKATMSRAEAVLLAVVPIAAVGAVLIATLIGADLGVALILVVAIVGIGAALWGSVRSRRPDGRDESREK